MFLFESNIFKIAAFNQRCADSNLGRSSRVCLLIVYFLIVYFSEGKRAYNIFAFHMCMCLREGLDRACFLRMFSFFNLRYRIL